ncbi:MAG TPA: threonine synthase [Candidatus Limnocylindria bacterium]|nr:threonine synthase [Candidatus Limnocylindria bacterium]
MTNQATTHRPDPYVSDGTSPPTDFQPAFIGLRCRACGEPAPTGPVFVCVKCLGPLEATYDLPAAAARLTRKAIDARPPSLWRLAELLPVETIPHDGLAVGFSPLIDAPRLAHALGLERLWVKDDSRNPTLSFKDRVVAVAAARALEFGFHTLACASTGNLSASVAAAAAALGLRAVVFVPADLEPAKVAQAQALGATIVRVDGPYDDVNRLCLELTDELDGWAVVNVNLRPYYAEGSKTLAFEIAQQLGWRAPDAVVAPLASGSLYTKLAKGFAELAEVGLTQPAETRYVGGQAAGCAPIATAFAEGADSWRPVLSPQTVVRSLAIGTPADGVFALRLARQSRGAIFGVEDAETIAAIRLLAETEGILTETAGGVTLAALRRAITEGTVNRDDEVVLVITGNGLKTLDVINDGRPLPEPIPPTFDAFERWWEERERRQAA